MRRCMSARDRKPASAMRMRQDIHRNAMDRFEHAGVHHFVGRAALKQAAAVQRDHVVAETRREIDVVQHDHDRERALVGQRAQQAQHLDLMRDVERGSRLVEQQTGRGLRHQHREPDALTLAAREVIGELRGETRGVGEAQRLVDMRVIVGAQAAERAVPRIAAQRDQLAHGHVGRGGRILRQIRDLPREFARGPVAQRRAAQTQRPARARLLAREQLDQRALARAVMTDQRGHAAGGQDEVERLQQDAPVRLEGGAFEFEQRRGRRRRRRRPHRASVGAGVAGCVRVGRFGGLSRFSRCHVGQHAPPCLTSDNARTRALRGRRRRCRSSS
ncbi:hypothetical protein PT2222_60115 [Paraburkholderia tropica]